MNRTTDHARPATPTMITAPALYDTFGVDSRIVLNVAAAPHTPPRQRTGTVTEVTDASMHIRLDPVAGEVGDVRVTRENFTARNARVIIYPKGQAPRARVRTARALGLVVEQIIRHGVMNTLTADIDRIAAAVEDDDMPAGRAAIGRIRAAITDIFEPGDTTDRLVPTAIDDVVMRFLPPTTGTQRSALLKHRP